MMKQYLLEFIKDGKITKSLCKGESGDAIVASLPPDVTVISIKYLPPSQPDPNGGVIAEWALE